uniref:FLZ-type domain-containing protein n=1 Tax=Peronospora matthiolae TaxID=2874970 RepID=A0AAV1TWW2_9STRA
MCSPTTASSTSTCIVDDDTGQKRSIYLRAWQFLQRRLHLRPRACSCPVDMESQATPKTVEDSLVSSHWQHGPVWRKLDTCEECSKEMGESMAAEVSTQPRFRTQAQRKAAQITCHNCGLLFFRPLSVAMDTSAFCGLDCQSSFEYRRRLQDAVNKCEGYRGSMNWTRSSEL